jgi:hypothetical protein
MHRDGIEIVVPASDTRGDALSRDRISIVCSIHWKIVKKSIGVPESVQMIKMDVCDDSRVGKRDSVTLELGSEVRTRIDQYRTTPLALNVDRKPGALDAAVSIDATGTHPLTQFRLRITGALTG